MHLTQMLLDQKNRQTLAALANIWSSCRLRAAT